MARNTSVSLTRALRTRRTPNARSESLETRRLLSFGDLEPLFGGGDGKVATDFGPGATDIGRAVVVQPDGKIVVGGSWDGGSSDFAIARYNPDGTLDTTFAGDGTFNTAFAAGFGGAEFINDVALQADGKIVAIGYTNNINGAPAPGGNDWAIVRVNTNGTLDGTFSGDGRFTINFGFDDRATGVAVRPGGQIVVGGFLDGGSPDFGIAQITTAGVLDAAFGNVGAFGFPGASTLNLGNADFASDLALHTDGKAVLVGHTNAGAASVNDWAVARFNVNGSVDTTFDTDGWRTIDFGFDDRATGVAVRPTGQIVIGGFLDGGSADFGVAQLLPSGAFDTTFGNTGGLGFPGASNVNIGAAEFAQDLILRPDGGIVLAGYHDPVGPPPVDFAVVRFNVNGALDTSLDGDGIKTINLDGGDSAFAVAATRDGSLILAGITTTNFGVVRLRGALDLGFHSDGLVTTDLANNDTAETVIVQPDGKVLVGGTTDGGAPDFAIARYIANGTLDNTFGGGIYGAGSGITSLTFSPPGFGGRDVLTDIALQPDGKIVAVGHTNLIAGVPSNGFSDWAVARFNADGSYDNTFSGDGRAIVHFDSSDFAAAVVIRPDGKIVVAGSVITGITDSFAVAQFNADGTLDTAFGNTGAFGFPGASSIEVGHTGSATDVVLQSDGKAVIAGFASFDVAVARLNADGTPDTSFDGDGRSYANVSGPPPSNERAHAVVIGPGNTIVTAGWTNAFNPGVDFLAARFGANGAYDAAFTNVGPFGADEMANDIVLAPDGGFILGGESTAAGDNDFAVMRIHGTGASDTSFDAFGTVPGPFSVGDKILIDFNDAVDEANGVAMQPDGKVLLAGRSGTDFAVARLSARMMAASARFEFETVQQLLVQFSAAFSGASASDFTLQNLTTGATVPAATISLTDLGNGLARLRFPGQNGSGVADVLPNGRYRLTLPPGAVTDSAGNPNVGTFTFEFFFLMADANRDAAVNLTDFNVLAANFGASGRTFSQGNFNYDAGGLVNLQDFNLLAAAFGTAVAPDGGGSGAIPPGAGNAAAGRVIDEDELRRLIG